MRKHGLRMELLNGGNTNTPEDPDNIADIANQYANNNAANEGRHESEEYYYLCEQRSQQYGMHTLPLNVWVLRIIYTESSLIAMWPFDHLLLYRWNLTPISTIFFHNNLAFEYRVNMT